MSSPHLRVDRLWPDPAAQLPLDEAFARVEPPPALPNRPGVAINMVTSVDGRAQIGGGAEGLGSRTDRRLMRLLRAGFDAVACGSGTLRAAGFWPGVPDDLARRRVAANRTSQPVSVVIAGAQPISLADWHAAADQPRVLIVGSHFPQQALPGAELLRAPTPDPEPSWVLEQLARRRVASVLLEGGPTTNAAFLAADCIDEVFWTVGAMLLGTDALSMIAPIPGGSPWAGTGRRGALLSVHRSGDELFLRYRFG